MKVTRRLFIVFSLFLLFPATGGAAVRLPAVIGSNMVLQQGMELNIWGWASPGEAVRVVLNGNEASTEADRLGEWKVRLPAQEAGGPYTMRVSGENSIELQNILIGEVWVCSGQSNMEKKIGPMPGQRPVINWVQEIAGADYPEMRLFHIPRATSGVPVSDVNAAWMECSPENIRDFSAVAYFFGRDIHRETGYPVGLIMTSWGGTRAEPWTPPSGFAQAAGTAGIARRVEIVNREYREKMAAYLDAKAGWEDWVKASDASGGPLPPAPLEPVHPLNDRQEPTGLYNAMVAPVVSYGIRGAIWYQGESNRGDRLGYADKMEALIKGWRTEWKQGDFPFYFVQLAPYNYSNTDVVGHTYPEAYYLPEIWAAQLKTLRIPNTGIAVTTDITELYDIHPTNKLAVGKRLALWALAGNYGKSLVVSGPLYKDFEVEGSRVRVSFDHTGRGLASQDGEPLNWFEIAGPDGVFRKADAVIAGGLVVVSSPEVESPSAVRFGWHEMAVPNLVNREGLPASPFSTQLLP